VSIDNTIADQADSPLSSLNCRSRKWAARSPARRSKPKPADRHARQAAAVASDLSSAASRRAHALGDEGTSNSTNPSAESSMS